MEDAWAVARFNAFAELNAERVEMLRGLAGPVRAVEQGEIIRNEGDRADKIFLLCSGWTASSMIVAGGARQIIKVHLPGDLLGLPSLALTRAADTLSALTPATIISVEPEAIGRLFASSAHLATLLFLISQEERVMLMDRVASLGRTDAMSRVTALIVQLHARVLRNDRAAGLHFYAPLTQTQIADLTGLTKVHVNRTLQKLRADGVVDWARRWITIHDDKALQRLAGIPQRVLASPPAWLPVDS